MNDEREGVRTHSWIIVFSKLRFSQDFKEPLYA